MVIGESVNVDIEIIVIYEHCDNHDKMLVIPHFLSKGWQTVLWIPS